jgi:hypothetical protein
MTRVDDKSNNLQDKELSSLHPIQYLEEEENLLQAISA